MKRWFITVLTAICLSVPLITVAAPALSDKLFAKAKDAVTLISYGEYEKALNKLDLSKNVPGAGEFGDFAENELSDIFYGEPQKDVAVAYYASKRWIIAVPVVEPSDDDVETLLLSSSDGKSFDAYRSAQWGDVMSAVNKSDDVIWNIAYNSGVQYAIADN